MFKNSKKKAQQLVEFALVAPILLIVVLIIMEMGYAINVRSVLSSSTKVAVAQAVQNFTGVDNPSQEFITNLEVSLSEVLEEKGFDNDIKLQLVDIPSSDKLMIIASTEYRPAFGLNNVFSGIIPSQFNLSTYQTVNRNYLEPNHAEEIATLTQEEIENFWPDGPTGLMASNDLPISGVPKSDVQNQVSFLVDVSGNKKTKARLFNWDGVDLLPVNSYFNLTTGDYMVKSPYPKSSGGTDNKWEASGLTIEDVLISMGFTHGLYVGAKKSDKINIDGNVLGQKKIEESSDFKWVDERTNSLNLKTGASESLSGSFENVNNAGAALSKSNNIIEEYVFKSSEPAYLLKVYLPTGSLNNQSTNKKQEANNINAATTDSKTAKLTDAHNVLNDKGVDIVASYTDSDGDFIPDQYDADPEYPDMNFDGKLDGENISNASEEFSESELKRKKEEVALPDDIEVKDKKIDQFVGFIYDEKQKAFFIENDSDIDIDASENISERADFVNISIEAGSYVDNKLANLRADVQSESISKPSLFEKLNNDEDYKDYCIKKTSYFAPLNRKELVRRVSYNIKAVSPDKKTNSKFKNNKPENFWSLKKPDDTGVAEIASLELTKITRGNPGNFYNQAYCGDKKTESFTPLYFCTADKCYRKALDGSGKPIEVNVDSNGKKKINYNGAEPSIARGLDFTSDEIINNTPERVKALSSYFRKKVKNNIEAQEWTGNGDGVEVYVDKSDEDALYLESEQPEPDETTMITMPATTVPTSPSTLPSPEGTISTPVQESKPVVTEPVLDNKYYEKDQEYKDPTLDKIRQR